MKKYIIIPLLLLIPLTLFGGRYRIYTENAGLSSYIDMKSGKISGFSVDIVREIQRRIKDDSPIEILPWARGYMHLKKGPNVILFQTTRTPERENLFKWVGPISSTKWIFYARKGSNLEINSLDDARKVKLIACYKDDVKHDFLKNNDFKNLKVAYGENAHYNNLILLKKGGVDLIILNNWVMSHLIKKYEFTPNDFEIKYIVKKQFLYLAFSKDISDSVIQKWQNTLNNMKKDGTYLKIMKNYPDVLENASFENSGTF